MGLSAAVAGASGYAGGELLRLLDAHPDLSVEVVAAASNAGELVTSVHPHLRQFSGRVFEPTEPDRLAEADVVFLALPHGQSAAIAAQLPDPTLIVDLGADFRLRDPAQWVTYYGGSHAGAWTYGLPELAGARSLIAGSRRIASPGCYATAITLALAPLYAAGLAEPADVVVVAASGTTGAGRGMKQHLMASDVMGSLSPYKVGGSHQHTPEIEQALSGRRRATRHALVHAGARTDATRHPGDLHCATGERCLAERLACGLRRGLWSRTVRARVARG